MLLLLEKGQRISRKDITRRLVEILYERNDADFRRGTFRVRGDVIEVFPTYDETAYRIELFGDEIESLVADRSALRHRQAEVRAPAHLPQEPLRRAAGAQGRRRSIPSSPSSPSGSPSLKPQGRMVEAQRVHQRTRFDLEMIKSMGYCHGIENYSRHFSGRLPGEAPPTLLDYFPRDFLLFVDESHATIPQVHGMWHGDRSRKQNLVDYGFRLPSAIDNRPLKFEEFENRIHQTIYVSATPGPYELTRSAGVVVEQVIRPTGLVDPEVEIRPVKGQIDDLLAEIRDRAKRNERVLVTTLTKRMSEDLAGYYTEVGVNCRYMHSEIETLERVKLLAGLRKGEFDVLIGINLLREGLDLPEVSLVAILDADKEGFLRSAGSLIQTMGRAARHLEGRAILYADRMTDSMSRAIDETDRRRTIQRAYNEEHGITPQSIINKMDMGLAQILKAEYGEIEVEEAAGLPEFNSQAEVDRFIAKLETEMREAARKFEFEKAAQPPRLHQGTPGKGIPVRVKPFSTGSTRKQTYVPGNLKRPRLHPKWGESRTAPRALPNMDTPATLANHDDSCSSMTSPSRRHVRRSILERQVPRRGACRRRRRSVHPRGRTHVCRKNWGLSWLACTGPAWAVRPSWPNSPPRLPWVPVLVLGRGGEDPSLYAGR